jgi:Tfp pilus assembly protein PilN
MPQQINLYNPILLAPRRHFSARAMAQALGLLAAVLVGASTWLSASNATLRRDVQASAQAQAAERDRLVQALAARPAASGVALEQELAQLQQGLAQRRRVLDELDRGRIVDGRSHAAMLRLVAQTVPAAAWITELRLVDGRLELTGLTLQPDALRPWLVRLADDPLTAGQQLAAVKLERARPAGASTTVPTWSFQLVSGTPASGGAP